MMHEIDSTEETRELAQSVKRRNDNVSNIWIYEYTIEFEVPIDSRGFWNSDSPESAEIVSVNANDENLEIKLKLNN